MIIEPEPLRDDAPERDTRPASGATPQTLATANRPGPRRLVNTVLAVAIVGGPLGFLVGGALSPSIHVSGQSAIAAAAAANATTNSIHIVAFVVASYLLPLGAIGLARLAYPRTPWLAAIGGLLAVLGWLPFSALVALDDVINVAASLPDNQSYAALVDRFSTDPVMGGYLVVYVVGHLVAYVLLGIALRRIIGRAAAWAMVASSPLTVLAFAIPGDTAGVVPVTIATGALALLVLGSIPAARQIARR